MTKRRGLGTSLLGRGEGSDVDAVLDVLAGGNGVAHTLREVSITLIDPSPWQPTTRWSDHDAEDFQGMMESIRNDGVLQPILVRPMRERFELMAGHGRWLASRAVGHTTVPARIMEVDDRVARRFARIENFARSELSAWQKAEQIRNLRIEMSEEIGGREPSLRELQRETGAALGLISEHLKIARAIGDELLLAAGVGVHAVNTLGRAALMRVADKTENDAKAIQLQKELGISPVVETAEIPALPFTWSEPKGLIRLRMVRPMTEFTAHEALELLSRLEPIMTTLRERIEHED